MLKKIIKKGQKALQLYEVCGRLMTRQPEGGQSILQSSAEGKRERKGSGKLPVNPIEQ